MCWSSMSPRTGKAGTSWSVDEDKWVMRFHEMNIAADGKIVSVADFPNHPGTNLVAMLPRAQVVLRYYIFNTRWNLACQVPQFMASHMQITGMGIVGNAKGF